MVSLSVFFQFAILNLDVLRTLLLSRAENTGLILSLNKSLAETGIILDSDLK